MSSHWMRMRSARVWRWHEKAAFDWHEEDRLVAYVEIEADGKWHWNIRRPMGKRLAEGVATSEYAARRQAERAVVKHLPSKDGEGGVL